MLECSRTLHISLTQVGIDKSQKNIVLIIKLTSQKGKKLENLIIPKKENMNTQKKNLSSRNMTLTSSFPGLLLVLNLRYRAIFLIFSILFFVCTYSSR